MMWAGKTLGGWGIALWSAGFIILIVVMALLIKRLHADRKDAEPTPYQG
jgi:hypothetical protein